MAAAAAGADQAAKRAVIAVTGGGLWDIEVIPDVFNLAMTWNRGISFGWFNRAGLGAWPFLLVSAVLIAALIVWMAWEKRPAVRLALALMLGGALGNVIDRMVWGAVADYIDISMLGWRFWTFNLADVWISLGALLLIASGLRQSGS